MSPDATHTATSPPGEPMLRPMSAETMKMPEPIMDPATSITASSSDSPCLSPASAAGAGGAARCESVVVMVLCGRGVVRAPDGRPCAGKERICSEHTRGAATKKARPRKPPPGPVRRPPRQRAGVLHHHGRVRRGQRHGGRLHDGCARLVRHRAVARGLHGDVRRDHQRHDGHQLDEDVHRRAGGVLERVAHGVAGHGRLVLRRAFVDASRR